MNAFPIAGSTRRLRPFLFTAFHRSRHPVTGRAFSCAAVRCIDDSTRDQTTDYLKRVAQLGGQEQLEQGYPRLGENFTHTRRRIDEFKKAWDGQLAENETVTSERLTVPGRVHRVRTAGSKLVFIDLVEGDQSLQLMCGFKRVANDDLDLAAFKSFVKTIRKGDWLSVTGNPHRTSQGELSINAIELPRLLSPSLHQIPERLDDSETRARHRHVDMLVNPSAIYTLRARHQVERVLTDHLSQDGFVKVQTPILTHGAGGAVARPFETQATELANQMLNLRIAPELWLKRLVVGGLTKVFEIGPAFRNEGVDATHNPEFSICEFYEAFATLDDLMKRTEDLLVAMSEQFEHLRQTKPVPSDCTPPGSRLSAPFRRLPFIPTLEHELQTALPDLSSPSAYPSLLAILADKNISVPANPTLPRLLDALASTYLEPLCTTPTFITHHPACLSPLSKHFPCPTTHQTVAARAELFIHSREYANMYEEENSPFHQRRKFVEQLQFRHVDGEGDGSAEVDESYLECLEWGLPPTGGWGCGIDRLVMYFAGRERMADVLPFGSLRNVVGLGRRGH